MIRTQQPAFSLVELSIVLVILGLLTGGILAGQSLIHAAELRSVATEHNRYQAAMNTFRDKYFGWPGDTTNAEALWTQAQVANAACVSHASVGQETCNGNGDGRIDLSVRSDERFRFWQHLASAGLIEGQFPGNTPAAATAARDIPASRFNRGGWNVTWTNPWAGNSVSFRRDSGANSLFIGSENGTALAYGPIFLAEDAWNIDTKIDDGKPGRGSMTIQYWSYCTDAADENALDANYIFTRTTNNKCTLWFKAA